MVEQVQTLSRRLHADGPQTDDELHAWVKVNIGVDIPRVAVCYDHDAPFTVLADCYFERVGSVLVLANRGGSKTFIVAILHYINATYKPGCEGLQFGATEAQGNRCYGNIEDWCYRRDKVTGRRTEHVLDWILDKPKKSETSWKNGSRVEVVPGSEKAVSGPHPQKAGADEIELMEDGTWIQSRGMAVAKNATGKLPSFMQSFNGQIPPQDVVTSTRNSLTGRMNNILKEVEDDLREGNIPEFVVYRWCIFETASEVPSCRAVDPEKRKARLIELGRDPDELCACNKRRKGYWHDGEPRTLESVCRGYDGGDQNRPVGTLFYSRGWKPYIDVAMTFKRNTPGTWVLQHECREGVDENAYIQDWSLSLHGIRDYQPHPDYGPIYQGVDWGSDAPHAVLYFQCLNVEVPGMDFEYQPIWLQPKIYVCFKELYVANIDAGKLADRVIQLESRYRKQFGKKWQVKDRFCDPAGKGERLTWSRKGLKSSWPVVTRNKERMIDTVANLVTDDKFAVDVEQCPMFCEEVEGWRRDPNTGNEVKKQRNHAMSAWRYGIMNAEVHEGRADPLSDTDTEGRRSRVQGESEEDSPNTESGIKTMEREGRERKGPLSFSGTQREHPTDAQLEELRK